MGFVYVPKRQVVSVWRPIEMLVSADSNVEAVKVKILRGGESVNDTPIFVSDFFVSNAEIAGGGIKRFKFDVSDYLRGMVEPFDGERPDTLGKSESMANECNYKLSRAIVPYKVEVSQFVKNASGFLEQNTVIDNYPQGSNEWGYGVNHSPSNGEDMYMGLYYPISGKAAFLSDWKDGNGNTVLKSGLHESLFVSWYIGGQTVQGVRVKRTQRNGSVTTGVYQWMGMIQEGSNENYKIVTTNIGGYGINGLLALGRGMSNLLLGDDVFLDVETDKYEIQYISNVADITVVVDNNNHVVGFSDFLEVTETIVVRVELCENELFKKVHWMNRRGAMDSKMFRMFARRTNKVTSIKNRKALRWEGESREPNDMSFRSVVRKGIESVVSYEVEEVIENEEALFLESLLETPCVYIEVFDKFRALVIEDAEIVPSDTDDGYRVIKVKFMIDNVNVKIE